MNRVRVNVRGVARIFGLGGRRYHVRRSLTQRAPSTLWINFLVFLWAFWKKICPLCAGGHLPPPPPSSYAPECIECGKVLSLGSDKPQHQTVSYPDNVCIHWTGLLPPASISHTGQLLTAAVFLSHCLILLSRNTFGFGFWPKLDGHFRCNFGFGRKSHPAFGMTFSFGRNWNWN